MREEITRYTPKLLRLSKLTDQQFMESCYQVNQVVQLISEDLISASSWKAAYALTADIDEDDTPFVALALETKAVLWTGDKKLLHGLLQKEFTSVISTQQLLEARKK
jgi:predicted nucleic acid-binding protein